MGLGGERTRMRTRRRICLVCSARREGKGREGKGEVAGEIGCWVSSLVLDVFLDRSIDRHRGDRSWRPLFGRGVGRDPVPVEFQFDIKNSDVSGGTCGSVLFLFVFLFCFLYCFCFLYIYIFAFYLCFFGRGGCLSPGRYSLERW